MWSINRNFSDNIIIPNKPNVTMYQRIEKETKTLLRLCSFLYIIKINPMAIPGAIIMKNFNTLSFLF